MNWEVVGSTGEWAGAIAVVITLFYLARQMKDATAVARSSARQAISQMNIDAWSVSIDPKVLALASTKAAAGDELSPEEQGNYNRWIVMRMRFIENAFYQYQGGLLNIDDWGLKPLKQAHPNDLMEIMDDRHGQTSTLVISQLPTDQWYASIGDNTLADAILDRLMHNAHRLQLKGESMRKILGQLTEDEHLG